MSNMNKIFAKQRKKKENEKKALEVIANKKAKKVPTSMSVPKTMRDKVEYAKQLSEEVYKDILPRLELVTEEKRIKEYFDKAISNGVLAIDTETNGLDRIDGKIAGLCLYTPGEKGIYIPIGHTSYMTGAEYKKNVSIKVIQREFNRCRNVRYILHNAKFDMHILHWMIGVDIVPYWDTMIAANLLDENEPHGLKTLYQKYVVGAEEEKKVASFSSLFNGIEFNKIPPEVGYMYAAFDPIMTYELYKFQEPYLTKGTYECDTKGLERVAEVFHNIEMPVLEVVFNMEVQGVDIDTELASKLKAEYTGYMTRAEEKFHTELNKLEPFINKLRVTSPAKYEEIKDGIDISSPQQLAILFYDVLGFVSPDNRKPRGTGEEILKSFQHLAIR